MSFVFPRIVSVSRPGVQTGVGAQTYGGNVKSAETVVASGLPASVQRKREGGRNDVKIPSDGKPGNWRIFIKANLGLIRDRDIITDDLGERYQVIGNYWGSLGYNCSCDKLEA